MKEIEDLFVTGMIDFIALRVLKTVTDCFKTESDSVTSGPLYDWLTRRM